MNVQLIRAPDHLGDGILALPAILALTAMMPSWIDGPQWCSWLYRDADLVPKRPIHFDRAILFKPSFSAAWRNRKIRNKIGLKTDYRSWLLTTGVPPGSGHRFDDYVQIAHAAGASVASFPRIHVTEAERALCPPIPQSSVLFLPTTASGPPVAWPGFRQLADSLRSKGKYPIFTGGPGEEDWVTQVAADHRVLPPMALSEFAALCTQVDAIYGNDSGLSHLATAARRGAGMDPDDVHIYCGSTDPEKTAAPGARRFRHSEPPKCWPCYRKRCHHDLSCMPTQSNALQVQGPSMMG